MAMIDFLVELAENVYAASGRCDRKEIAVIGECMYFESVTIQELRNTPEAMKSLDEKILRDVMPAMCKQDKQFELQIARVRRERNEQNTILTAREMIRM